MAQSHRGGGRRPHLRALTGLRFAAALHVFIFHAARTTLRDAPQWLQNVAATGYVGVSLFFVLSGFVLTYTYAPARTDGDLDVRAFWRARIARVYPVYLLGLAAELPFFMRSVLDAEPNIGPAALKLTTVGAAAITLTQAWLPGTACQWNCPGWSLSDEAFFYLLFPALLAGSWRLGSRSAIVLALSLWAATLLATAGFVALGSTRPGETWTSTSTLAGVLMFNPVARLGEFVIGVALGRIYVGRREAASDDRSRLPGCGVVSAMAAAAVFAALANSAAIPRLVLHDGLLAPVFAILIYDLAGGRGPLAWLLSRPAFVLLGASSYAFYILHVPVGHWLAKVARLAGAGPGVDTSPPFVLGYLALTTALSVFVFLTFEEPARQWVRRVRRPVVGVQQAVESV